MESREAAERLKALAKAYEESGGIQTIDGALERLRIAWRNFVTVFCDATGILWLLDKLAGWLEGGKR
jgi:hypothetical protein